MHHIEKPTRAAVVVPVYRPQLSSSEFFSLERTLNVLKAHDIFLMGPASLTDYFGKLGLDCGWKIGKKLFPDRYFKSPGAYSSLLKKKFFYDQFHEYEYILIVQLDAMVFSDQLEFWCDEGYSYIGAPWVKLVGGKIQFEGVGNGGFSLRKVGDFTKFLSTPMYLQNPMLKNYYQSKYSIFDSLIRMLHRYVFSWNVPLLEPRVIEDIFWGVLAPANAPEFKVPAAEKAASFAMECEPEALYELNHGLLPFGCHAWEKYNPEFWLRIFKEHGIDFPVAGRVAQSDG